MKKHFRRDNHIAMSAKQGKFQVQRVSYDRAGVATIEPLTGWLDFETAQAEMQKRTAITIVAVQSKATGRWSYCPEAALPIIGRVLEYDDDPHGWATADEALNAARADNTIPAGAVFKVRA